MHYREMCTSAKDCKESSSSADVMSGEDGDSDSALTEVVRCRASTGGQCCELCRSINTCSYTYSTLSRASGGTHRSTGKEAVSPVDECKSVDNATNGEQISTEGTLLRCGIASEYRIRLSPAYADRRKILIERKQIDNHVVQFREEFPYECCILKDMCFLEEEWLKFMRGLNRRCLALNRKVTIERFVGWL
uniref:Apple domain-containing protein n=1 Tax=Ascaris lumbricoides TaxID=6252 RepID=A0A0M3I8T2_ASCLU